MNVRRQADHVLAVVAFDQSGHGSELQLRNVGQLRVRTPVLHDREFSHVFHALHSMLRQFHLDLEGIAGVRIAPVVRLGKPGGRCGRHDRADHVGHGQAELAGAFPIDVDVQRRVVDLLGELKIAQEWQRRQLGAWTFCAYV